MKEWLVTVDVLSAKGYQQFTVKAKSEEDAIARVKKGEGKFVDESIEVTALGEARAELNE